jgi:ubiquinone/menaquinone biosynthesis C-methylase UbiE
MTSQQPERPYDRVLKEAGRAGQVLHRDNIYGSGPPNTAPNPEVFSLTSSRVRSPVLDVGCGIGAYVAALSAEGISAHGIEINRSYVETGRSLNRNVQWYDGSKIPFGDNSFDSVMAIEVLEHIPDWEHTFREMLRVALRSVLISVPNIAVIPSMSQHLVVPWHLLQATHVNFFTPEILGTFMTRVPDITCQVLTYGAFQVNGNTYHNHVFATIQKEAEQAKAHQQAS